MQPKKIQFLGCGKLGKIFLEIFLDSGTPPENIFVVTGSDTSLQGLASEYRINTGYCPDPDIVFLGIKPQQLNWIDLKHYTSNTLILSPLAGTSLHSLDTPAQTYRLMPNILLKNNHGTILTYTTSRSDLHDWCDEIFSDYANLVTCETEDMLDRLATIAGCGPAYYAYFSQIFLDAWCMCGGDKQEGIETMIHLLSGTGEVLGQYPDFDACMRTVASRWGITEKALETMDQEHIPCCIQTALEAAYQHGKTLRH